MNEKAVLGSLKQVWCAFANRHSKFLLFVRNLILRDLVPGTVVRISVILPGENEINGSFELTDEDIGLLGSLEED